MHTDLQAFPQEELVPLCRKPLPGAPAPSPLLIRARALTMGLSSLARILHKRDLPCLSRGRQVSQSPQVTQSRCPQVCGDGLEACSKAVEWKQVTDSQNWSNQPLLCATPAQELGHSGPKETKPGWLLPRAPLALLGNRAIGYIFLPLDFSLSIFSTVSTNLFSNQKTGK